MQAPSTVQVSYRLAKWYYSCDDAITVHDLPPKVIISVVIWLFPDWSNLPGCQPENRIKLVYRLTLVSGVKIFDAFLNKTSRQLKIGIRDISMKFTRLPTSKLKALLMIFNNCSVYAHFSTFKWKIVNYFVLVFQSSIGYIFICSWKRKILWKNLLHLMKSVVKNYDNGR